MVLNYRYFHTDLSTFFRKIHKRCKKIKTLKMRFYEKIKEVYKRLLHVILINDYTL